MALLDESEIEGRLAQLDGWSREGERISRSFECGDFVGSVEFVKSVVAPAEELNHHPDLAISWATVKVSITNHAEGGLTAADFELAGRLDALA